MYNIYLKMDADGSHSGRVWGSLSKNNGVVVEIRPTSNEVQRGSVVVDKVHLHRRAGAVNGVLGTGCVCRAEVELGKVELVAVMRRG